jgi:hypothetical protein
VCSIFHGENWDTCFSKTKEQIMGQYWESFRQEARQRLSDIHCASAVKSSKLYEQLVDGPGGLNDRANPVDPEADGDFGREDIRAVRGIFGKDAHKFIKDE